MKKSLVLILALALILSFLQACGSGTTLPEAAVDEIAAKYPKEMQFMEQQLGRGIAELDEPTFKEMQQIAVRYMRTNPDLKLSELITDLSLERFSRGAR